MPIDFSDISGEPVTDADMRQALVAVTRMTADVKLAAFLPTQIAMELPNVLRCVNELYALRSGVRKPIVFTLPPDAAADQQGG
jgi:hypothetical protein